MRPPRSLCWLVFVHGQRIRHDCVWSAATPIGKSILPVALAALPPLTDHVLPVRFIPSLLARTTAAHKRMHESDVDSKAHPGQRGTFHVRTHQQPNANPCRNFLSRPIFRKQPEQRRITEKCHQVIRFLGVRFNDPFLTLPRPVSKNGRPRGSWDVPRFERFLIGPVRCWFSASIDEQTKLLVSRCRSFSSIDANVPEPCKQCRHN